MLRSLRFILGILFLILFANACSNTTSNLPSPAPAEIPVLTSSPTQESTAAPALLQTEAPQVTLEYEKCGEGELVDVPFFFTDIHGNQSPTQLMRSRETSDGVRRYLSLVTCLLNDQGWKSDPSEVENGYENEIVFFDKYGKAHTYRIIIGGHYIDPYDPIKKDITSSLNGVDERHYNIEDWLQATYDRFSTSRVRQIGIDLYIDDKDGDLSKVFSRVYAFRETNLKIEKALQTGEGYPDKVPEGFFLFATESWLVIPE